MPELPEVETIRRDLAGVLRGKCVKAFVARKPKLLRNSIVTFRRALLGAQIKQVKRRAKQLLFQLSSEYTLLVHLKMSGQLVWRSAQGKLRVGGHPISGVSTIPNQYTYITLWFTDRSVLYFNDVRQFGYWRVVKTSELKAVLGDYGPEPLGGLFTLDAFRKRLERRRRTSIKAALLDQTVVAGIGNIYADESLYAARIRPSRRVSELGAIELERLHRAIRSVLVRAVRARGTSMHYYRDVLGREGKYWQLRLVYGRAGGACRRCGARLVRSVVAQRGTTYCPSCQA